MRWVNRLLVTLAALGAIVLALWVGLVDLGRLPPPDAPAFAWLLDGLELIQPRWQLWLLAAIIVGGLALLVAEITSTVPTDPPVVLRTGPDGTVMVARGGIRRIATTAALKVPGVLEARTAVWGRGNLRLTCRASVSPTAQLPEVASQVRESVRDAVEHFVGRPVRGVRVHTQLDPLDRRLRSTRVR